MNSINPPIKSDDLPVTKKMLDASIQEIKSEITGLRLDSKVKFDQIDARFEQMDKKFDIFMVRMDSRFEQVVALIQKTRAESEEQHSRPFSCREKFVRQRTRIILN